MMSLIAPAVVIGHILMLLSALLCLLWGIWSVRRPTRSDVLEDTVRSWVQNEEKIEETL
jgi:hypothetical protein